MCSDKIRYFKIDKGMIYVFNLTKNRITKYGFKPYHKRKRFRKHSLLYSPRHFYILSDYELTINDPIEYLRFCSFDWKEFRLGDYL